MAAYVSRETSSYNPYAAGDKIYGGGRSFPTMGPVDPLGYRERDATTKARRDAVLRRMQAQNAGEYASPDVLRSV